MTYMFLFKYFENETILFRIKFQKTNIRMREAETVKGHSNLEWVGEVQRAHLHGWPVYGLLMNELNELEGMILGRLFMNHWRIFGIKWRI